MYLRGQMNLSVFLKVKLLEMEPQFEVRTFDSVQFLGLSNGPDEIGFKDFRNVSLLARASSTASHSESDDGSTSAPPSPLQESLQHNLLCESQKVIEYDSLNALFNEGTNHYSKQPFIPLSTKKSTQPRAPRDEPAKLRVRDMKNGRLFELRDNVLFVDLLGETAVGNPEMDTDDSSPFSRGRHSANPRIPGSVGGRLPGRVCGARRQIRVFGSAEIPVDAVAGPKIPPADREP